MNNWNGLDFFIFLILTVNTILGMARGATKEIISMMCLSAALIFSIKFTVPLATFLNSSPLVQDVISSQIMQNFMIGIGAGPITPSLLHEMMYSLSLLICFVSIFSICEAGLSITGFTEVFSFPYAALNRKVGGSLGFIRGYIITLLFLSILVLHLYKADRFGSDMISGSFFARLFQTQYQQFDHLISAQRPEDYHQLYQNRPYDEQKIYEQLRKPEEPQMPTQQQPVSPAQPVQGFVPGY